MFFFPPMRLCNLILLCASVSLIFQPYAVLLVSVLVHIKCLVLIPVTLNYMYTQLCKDSAKAIFLYNKPTYKFIYSKVLMVIHFKCLLNLKWIL